MKNCRVCGSKLKLIYSLGSQPLANNLNKNPFFKSKIYPLNLCDCSKCNTLQHNININLNTLYSKYYYSSSVSKTVLDNAKESYNFFRKKFDTKKKLKMLEIGCNDGYLLQYFKKSFLTLGVDPSKNMTNLAKKKNLNIICDFFNPSLANFIKKKYGKFNLIIANNVFAHNQNIVSILKSVRKLIDDKGLISVEVQDGEYLLKHGLFDMVYHEHFFYFEKNSFTNLINNLGFKIVAIQNLKLHGRSLRFIFKKNEILINNALKRDTSLILNFKNKMKRHQNVVNNFFKQNQFKKIMMFGAAAKTTVFINYFNINSSQIMGVIDDTSLKQNKYIPNTSIKIYSSSKINTFKPDFIIITAWNYGDLIYKKISYTKKWGCKVLIFFPTLKFF